MNDVISLVLPENVDDQVADDLRKELLGLEEVEDTGSDTMRGIGPAELLLWIELVAGALSIVATASATLRKIVDRVRGKGIKGAVLELPNGVKISVDSASVDELTSLVSAWKLEES